MTIQWAPRIALFCAIALGFSACSEDSRPSSRRDAGRGGMNNDEDGGETQGETDAGATTPRGDGSTGGSSDAGSGGRDGRVTPGTDGASNPPTSDGGGAPPGDNDPIIPTVAGACPTFITGTINFMGLSAEVVAGAPGATKGPLLFNWHGTTSNGSQALFQTPQSVQSAIRNAGGLIIAPTSPTRNGGTFGPLRGGQSPNGVWSDGDDLDWADQVAACAVQNHNIDPRRVYVTGCSAGGLMAATMAVKRSSYVAAAYPDSGGLVGYPPATLEDRTRVPAVLAMHGGSDDSVAGANFGRTSGTLLTLVEGAGGLAVECNHMLGHCRAPTDLRTAAWQFVMEHPFGVGTSVAPSGLPDYCVTR